MLYSLSYTLKFTLKRQGGPSYRVGPLEGLWWADDPAAFVDGHKDRWSWTMMIAQPDEVTPELFAQAVAQVGRKQLTALPHAGSNASTRGCVGRSCTSGRSAPRGPAIARLHEFIRDQGLSFGDQDRHHEIYPSDPRRSALERWRTIIRQPCSPT